MESDMSFTDVEKQTKAIYIKQHQSYLEDKALFNRFYTMAVNPAMYGLDAAFFKGKKVLDAGCGNTAYFQKAMFDLGCAHINCLDIGNEWVDVLDNGLKNLGIPKSFYSLDPGTVTQLPYADGTFDFVCSNGVLMHIEGIDQAEKAVKEMARVTKKGGKLYIYVGISKPGILDTHIIPALRKAYKDTPEFKDFVDNLNADDVQSHLARYVDIARTKDKTIDVSNYEAFFKLFTLDSATFVQNVIQVPVRQEIALGLEWITETLKDLGITKVQRLPTAYWPRNDFRKYLAPVHYDYDNPLTKLFYGDGHLKVIAEK